MRLLSAKHCQPHQSQRNIFFVTASPTTDSARRTPDWKTDAVPVDGAKVEVAAADLERNVRKGPGNNSQSPKKLA